MVQCFLKWNHISDPELEDPAQPGPWPCWLEPLSAALTVLQAPWPRLHVPQHAMPLFVCSVFLLVIAWPVTSWSSVMTPSFYRSSQTISPKAAYLTCLSLPYVIFFFLPFFPPLIHLLSLNSAFKRSRDLVCVSMVCIVHNNTGHAVNSSELWNRQINAPQIYKYIFLNQKRFECLLCAVNWSRHLG